MSPKDDETTTRSHSHELTIEAPLETVWKAITTPEALTNWFPLEAEVEPGPEGRFMLGWGDFRGTSRTILWEPPRHLRTAWMDEPPPGETPDPARRRLVVDWYLDGKGGRTVLRLVHSGFGLEAKWDDEYESTDRGWDFELRSLKHYLERHAGATRRAFWLRRPAENDAARVWQRMTGPGGLLRSGSLAGLRPGDSYRLTLASGDEIAGQVLIHRPPTDFAGTVENWNDGLFRIGFETGLGQPEANLWLSTWDVSQQEVDQIQGRWEAALAQALAA